jgi:hypothetical protein
MTMAGNNMASESCQIGFNLAGTLPRRLFVFPIAYLVGIMTISALLLGWQDYQLLLAYHKKNTYFSLEVANHLADSLVWTFIALLIWQLLRIIPVHGPKLVRNLGVHTLIAGILSPIACFAYVGVLFICGFATEDMTLKSRLVWNLHATVISNVLEYFMLLGFIAAVDHYQRYRLEQQHSSKLRVALAESKLQTLRAQLNPHFIFNALNSVSCLIHTDVERADSMLARVANLLRLTLSRDDSQQVPLLEEVELAEEYLEIQQIRFGSKLQLLIRIDDDVLDVPVPSMLLQPLVENACVHGVARTQRQCRLEIRAKREHDSLVLTVYNDGPPLRADWKKDNGIGLRNTVERLRLLYGEDHLFEVASFDQGVRAIVRIPMTVPAEAVTSEPTHAEFSGSPLSLTIN